MKRFRGIALIALASVFVLSLTACGGNKSASKSSDNHDSKSSVSSTKKAPKKKSSKTKLNNDENQSEKESSKQQNVGGKVSNKTTNKNTTSSNNSSTSAGTIQKSQTSKENNASANMSRSVNTTDDALSLYTHYLGMNGNPSDGYTATPISGGFVVTPKEPAYGHSQVVIKYDGSAYSTDGKLVATAAEMMAPNNSNTAESGWHGA